MTNVEDLEESIKKQKLPKSDVYPNLLLLADLQDHFECGRCGKCCREQHPVCVKYDEIRTISQYMGMGYKEWKEFYLDGTRDEDRLFIRWDGKCPFLIEWFDKYGINQSACMIYEVRPKACRVYPFFTFNNIRLTTAKKLHLSPDCPSIKEQFEKRIKQIREGNHNGGD